MTNTNVNRCNILFTFEDTTPKIRNYPYNKTSVQDLLVNDTCRAGRINVRLFFIKLRNLRKKLMKINLTF